MKKRYRDKALNELFASLGSADFDEREFALFQVALLLWRDTPTETGRQLPEPDWDSLPRALRRMRLGEEEQRKIVDELALVMERRPESRATAFWALGEASADLGWSSTLAVIAACGRQLGLEAAYQACRALHSWLADERFQPEQILEKDDIGTVAEMLVQWTQDDDRRLSKEASAALAGIRRLET